MEDHIYQGQIRVGRMVYRGGKPIHPTYPGFTPIVVLTKSSPYGELGPYVLKDEDGTIMENAFQFRKAYPWVPEVREVYSRWDPTVIWSHPEETHMDEDGELTDEFWAWRAKGLANPYAVRYPVGNTSHRNLCQYLLTDDGRKLGIVDGRREVYLGVYAALVKKERKFKDLVERLKMGENLLIIEVDGPHQEALQYYMDTYDVPDHFIEEHTMLATESNLEIMLNDTKFSFGHGYCLAMAILGLV